MREMGKSKARTEAETLKTSSIAERERREELDKDGEEEDGDEEEEMRTVMKKERGGFYACYLLTSLSPRHKGQTYIGFTVNPRRRIRQHNGEISSGAWRTKKKRPWEMVLCIYGFRTHVAALQFEWAWQHPVESLAVRKAAVEFKSLNGLANKIKLAFTMLTLHTWQRMDLSVNIFSTKYMQHTAGCPPLPQQINVRMGSMDDLPCYSGINPMLQENTEADWDHVVVGLQSPGIPSIDKESLSQGQPGDANYWLCHDSSHLLNTRESIAGAEQQPQIGNVCDSVGVQGVLFSQSDNLRWESVLSFPQDRSAEQGGWILQDSSSEKITSPSSQPSIFSQFDLLERNDSSPANGTSTDAYMFRDEDKTNAQGDRFVLIEEESDDQKNSYHRVSNKPWILSHEQVEVVDLFTPSPDCRDHAGGKRRRRVCTGCPEVIDLTKSPIFVQL